MTSEEAYSLDTCDKLAYFRERFVFEQPDLIYLNGNLVFSDTSGAAEGFAVGPLDVTSYLIPGENLIAVKAHDSFGGGQVLELGLFGTVIPEPSTLVLLCTGAVGLLAFARRRRRRR